MSGCVSSSPSSSLSPVVSRQSLGRVRGVPAETLMGGDAALQSSRVTRERETVTDLVMEDNMTAMLAVKETWCVEVTTVSSLENIIILKMTAVTGP